MNAVGNKLKSKSGISLAIALVFFLLCAMVGTVVLAAASTSAGSTARERQLYRQTAALTSAANLLRQDVRAMSFTGSYLREETVTTIVDPDGNLNTTVETDEVYRRGAPTLGGSQFFHLVNNADGTFSDNLGLTERYFLNQGMPELVDLAAAAPAAQTIVFGAVEAQNIPAVTGSLTVAADYTLTAVLQCGENTLTMAFPPNATEQTAVGEPVVTKVSENTTKKVTATTYSTTLTWGQPLMKEGGADDGQAP